MVVNSVGSYGYQIVTIAVIASVSLMLWNVYPKVFMSPWLSILILFTIVSYIAMTFTNVGVNANVGSNMGAVGANGWIGKYMIGAVVICVSVILYTYLQSTTGFAATAFMDISSGASAFKYIITAFIAIVALALSHPIVSDSLKRMDGWAGFIANLVYALPCLLTDWLRYIMQEYATTHRIFLVLLAMEAGLIASYIWIPRLILTVRRRLEQGTVIRREVLFLRDITDIPNTVHAQPTTYEMTPAMQKMGNNQMYAISLWLFITPINIDEDDPSKYSIFRFGGRDNVANGKPSIHFMSSSSSSKQRQGNMLRIGLTDKKDNKSNANKSNANKKTNYTYIPVPVQRWNSVIFNYANNGADVFLNGELVHHESFTKDTLPSYSNKDSFIFGNESNTSLGAVQQVMYYDRPLPAHTIQYLSNKPLNT